MNAKGKLARWMEQRFLRAEASPRRIEEVMEAIRGRLRGTETETDEQWRALHAALERERSKANPLRSRRVYSSRFSLATSIGAAILVVGAVALISLTSPTAYETARGGQTSITLGDGSEVVLNHSSELLVSHALFERARHVTLKGEAFFRVQKDGSPFVVSTEVGTVRVLGTEFNVKVRGGALELAVLRGSVRLSVARNGVDSGVVVNKDQIVTCSREAFPQEPGPLRFSSFPGWMHGKLMFYRTPLSSACEEIEARFDVVVRLRNPRLQNETITGVVDAQNVDSALTALTRLAGTAYRNEQGVYTLY